MEVYDDDNCIVPLPTPLDYSLDNYQFVQLFCPRNKEFQKKNVINKYVFSLDKNFLCITRSRSRYRVIGRLFSICSVPYVKRNQEFDVFCVDDLAQCIQVFCSIVYELCKSHTGTFF